MFNQKIETIKPDVMHKLETRLVAAKKRLSEVQAAKPDDKAAQWIVARKVYDIEMEIAAWQRLK